MAAETDGREKAEAMVVVYFRRVYDGCIINYQKLENISRGEIEERVRRYNKEYTDKNTAHIVEIEKGSFLEYLIDKCEKGITYTKSSVEDAITAIESALDAVQDLKVAER